MSDKFGNDHDPYLYPGLNVMRNRLGVYQAQRLAQAACELTALHAATIELGPLKRGLPYLRATHCQLYRNIFDQAGHLHEVNIYQDDTRFCHFAHIEGESSTLMRDLEDESRLVGLPEGESIDRLAHYYCEISVLHPFRIGSGLARRIFPEQLAIHVGYVLSWDGIPVEGWSQANQSGVIGDLSILRAIFHKVVSEASETEQNSAVLMYWSHHDPAYR